jgi:O-antigen/teichoic acid export membrane protein
MNIGKIKNVFTKGAQRSVSMKRNMLYIVLLKIINICVSLIIVPVTLGYLAEEEYGIWLTLSSMLAWIGFFDIGLTCGLRNKLTEALATNDTTKARVYISTTLSLLVSIIVVVFFAFIVIYRFVNWGAVFNTDALSSQSLGRVVFVTILFYAMRFILNVVTTVYYAVQRPAVVDFINTLGSVAALGIIYLMTHIHISGSLFGVALVFSSIPVIFYIIAYFSTFYNKYRYLMPSVRFIQLKYTKDLMGLGVNFFLVQITALVLFATSNFIITQLLSPSDVTIYNIAFKYYNVVLVFFTLILNPLWSAVTDAYVKQDFAWMGNAMRKMILLWVISVLGIALMTFVSTWVYEIWVGAKIASSIPFSLSIACAIYVSLYNWSNIFAYFVNGVGKIRLQFYIGCGNVLLYIPMSIFFVREMGIKGTVYALCIILIPACILLPIQYIKIMNHKNTGIWNQ